MQLKFGARYCYDKKRIIEITDSYAAKTRDWSSKIIINNQAHKALRYENIHHLKVSYGYEFYALSQDFRFNHYNFMGNEASYSISHGFSTPGTRFTTNDDMKRYWKVMEQLCDNKCS